MRACLLLGLALATPAAAEPLGVPAYAVGMTLSEGTFVVARPNLTLADGVAGEAEMADGFGERYTVALTARSYDRDGERAFVQYRLDRLAEPVDGSVERRSYAGVAVVPLGRPTAIAIDGGGDDTEALNLRVLVTTAIE